MINLNDLTIRKKMIGIILLTSVVILIIGFIFVISNEIITKKKELIDVSLVEAGLIGESCVVYLSFNDRDGADMMLKNIKSIPTILAIRIYDENNKLFSEFKKPGEEIFTIELKTEVISEFSEDHLHIFHRILYNNRFYGTVFLKVSTEMLSTNINNFLILMLVLIIVLIFLSYFIASKLQNIISGPILDLANATKKISKDADYSLRVHKQGNDEIGLLFDGFNRMLEQIEIREEERNKAVRLMRESEEKYHISFKTLSDAAFLIDQETGRIIEINDAAMQIYGYSRKEWLKMKNTDFLAEPENTEKATEELANFIPVEFHIKKDGTVFPVEITRGTFIHKERQLIFTTARDITIRNQVDEALYESEKRLQLSLKINNSSVFEVNFETEKILSTAEVYLSLGYEPNEIPRTMKDMTNLIHPEDFSRVMEAVTKHIKGEIPDYYAEFRMRTKSGEWRWIEEKGKVIKWNDKGEPAVLLGISRDINKHKLAEEELDKYHEQLEKMVAERTTELEEKNLKLREFNKLFVGREFRIKELKDKIKELQKN